MSISHFSWFFRRVLWAYFWGCFFPLGSFSLPAAESPRKLQKPSVRQDRISGGDEPARAIPSPSRWMNRMSSPAQRGTDWMKVQASPRVIPRVLSEATPGNVSLLVSLSRQRIYMKVGEEIAIDSPICSGKASGMTPRGHFTILEKDPDHRSSVYGDYVDRNGVIVRTGISLKIDSAPSGTNYVETPMRSYMRLSWEGWGMHAGYLPGYPAAHGCIRLPDPIAEMIYHWVSIGTLVVVAE